MPAATARIESWRYRLLALLLLALSALAWSALWWWGDSPYVHYLHHAHLHDPPGGGGQLAGALVFITGWTLMTVAMMLPTSIPLVTLFGRIAHGRPDRPLLVGLVVIGYLLAWAAFGAVAYAGAVALRATVARTTWLAEHGWAFGATILLLAGGYQFTALKFACLDKCRSPFLFIMEHWTGTRHARQALWLGVHHGLFCVGCCWTLMLLMFPFGAGNLGWMLILGMLMAVEKNLSWGRRFTKPLGVVLLLAGVAVALGIDARL